VALFALLTNGVATAQNNVIVRYVRVGGNDLRTGVTASVDPTNPSGAFATIQRAIDQFRDGAGLVDPNTGLQIARLAPGTTYIIDVGPGVYNDPHTIYIPDNYAVPGLQQQLIIRGPRLNDTPNAQAYPGGPMIREYSPITEAIIQTPYGATIPTLRSGHQPLSVPSSASLLPMDGTNSILNIGNNNRVTIDGLMFEATSNNGGGVIGGRIITAAGVGVLPTTVSTTTLRFEQNVFLGNNAFDVANNNAGITYFSGIVSLSFEDNRFYNITWDPVNAVFSNNNSRRAAALWIDRVYDINLQSNHFIGNLNADPITFLPIRTMDDAIHIENNNLRSVRVTINDNSVSKNRGTAIYVDNKNIVQDTTIITNNKVYDVRNRNSVLYNLNSAAVPNTPSGIHVRNTRSTRIESNRIGADFGFNPVNGVEGNSIFLEDARPHTLQAGFMHSINNNIITNGLDGDGIVVLRGTNVEVLSNTITSAFYSGIHISDANPGGIAARMENIMVRFNNITRCNNRDGVGGSGSALYDNYVQSGGIAIYSDVRNAGQFNTSTKLYVTNNILRQNGNAGVVFRNNNSAALNVPGVSGSNYHKKDIRVNYNIFDSNDDVNDPAYNPGFGVNRNNDGVKIWAQNPIFSDGALRFGQLDVTGNWWDYESVSAQKYGPADVNNPLNNFTFPAGGLNNVGAGRSQRINQGTPGQTTAILYSPWLAGRVMDVEANMGSGNAPSHPDDDEFVVGYQNQSPVYYVATLLNGTYGFPSSIGINPDFSYPNSLTQDALSLVPRVDVGGVDGMINKAISLAKNNDIIEVWRGLYSENIVVPNKFGTVTEPFGRITIRSVENQMVLPVRGVTTANSQATNYRGYSATLTPGTNGIANIIFTPTVATNPSQEATVRQIQAVTMGAALNILDNNRVGFMGFRIETTANQAVNSTGENVGVGFVNNLVEVFPSQRNQNVNGLASFRSHNFNTMVVGNVFRRIAGQSVSAAVALNVVNCDSLMINDNQFDGGQTMSTGIRLEGCEGNANAIHVMRNEVMNTYQSGIITTDNPSSGLRSANQHIAENNIYGNNTQNAANHGGLLIQAQTLDTDGIEVEFNNIFNNRRAGIVLPGGRATGVSINYNLFHNNDPRPGIGTALLNNATGTLNASGNWWGSVAGPIIGASDNATTNSNRNNSGNPNLAMPSAIDNVNGQRLSMATPQQRIIGNATNYNPWLGGNADDVANNGIALPDNDRAKVGAQLFSAPLAWYVGVWNAGALPTDGTTGFIQRAHNLSNPNGGDWIFFHDDDYRDSKQNTTISESLVANRNLMLSSLPAFTRFEDITSTAEARLELRTDFEVRNISLAAPNGNGSIYTFPYRAILPPPAGQGPQYQLYNLNDLKTLTFTGAATEGPMGRFVHGRLRTSRIAESEENRRFGNIGFTLLPSTITPSLLGRWSVTRTADTKNQVPSASLPDNPANAPDRRVPPVGLNSETSPFISFNGSPSIDQAWIVSYEGNDPIGWSVRLNWFSDNDPQDLPEVGTSNLYRSFLPTEMFVGNLAGIGPGVVAPAWNALEPVTGVSNNDPRALPSVPGVIIPISTSNFDYPLTQNNERRGLFTAFASVNRLRAYAGENKAICQGADGVLLGGRDPLGDEQTNPLENAFTARGGVPPYTYTWTCNRPNCGLNFNNIPNPIAKPSFDSTVYRLEVRDRVGNVSVDTVTLFVNALPTVNFNLPAAICQRSPVLSLVSNVTGGRPFRGNNRPLGFDYLYYWTVAPNLGSAISGDQLNNLQVNPSDASIVANQPYRFTLEVEDANGCIRRVTQQTTFSPNPTANAGAARVQVCQDQTRVIGGNPAGQGGTGNLSYNWSISSVRNVTNNTAVTTPAISTILNNANTANPTFTPNITGVQNVFAYALRLEVRDVNNCTDVSNTTVEVYPLPMANAGADMEYCYNNLPVMLGDQAGVGSMGTAPYTYSWTPASPNAQASYIENASAELAMFNAPNVSAVETFTYAVRVTDAIGCRANDVVSLRVHPELRADAGSPIQTCVNSVFVLGGDPVATGGTGRFAYQWSPSQSLLDNQTQEPRTLPNPSARLPFPGTYTYNLRVTNPDVPACEAFASVQVVVGTQLQVNAGMYAPVCAGSDLQINAMIPGVNMNTPGYRYNWTPAARLSASNVANPVFNTTVPGTYTYTVNVLDPNGCQGSATTTIVVNPIPTVNAGNDIQKCAGDVVSLNGMATGGSPVFPFGYNYRWTPAEGVLNPFSSNTQLSLRFPGTYNYTLTATDGNNCSTSDNITVVVHALPSVDAGANVRVCPGATATFAATVAGGLPGYTYMWSPVTNLDNAMTQNPNFSSRMSGNVNYSLTVSDANGCRNSDNLTVTVLPNLIVNAGSDAEICPAGIAQIRASVSGGTPGFSNSYIYSWSPATNLSNGAVLNPSFSSTVPGSYNLTLTARDAEGCTESDVVVITVNPNPIANAGADFAICSGSSTQLQGSATSGDGNYSYSWTPATSLSATNVARPTFTAGAAGIYNYTLTVVDGKGCTTSDMVMVTVNSLPSVNAGADVSVCVGNTIQLQAIATGGFAPTGYAYSWDPIVNLSNATISAPVFNALDPRRLEYTVTATDANGCQGRDMVVVFSNPNPVASAGLNKVVCANRTTTLDGNAAGGTAPYSYTWLPQSGLSSGTAQVPTFTPAGNFRSEYNYTLVVRDANGCSSQSAVSVLVNPAPTASAGPDRTICAGGLTTLIGTGNGGTPTQLGYNYNWTPSTGLDNNRLAVPTVSLSQPGVVTYTLEISDANGCMSTDQAVVTVAPALVANAGGSKLACASVPTALNTSVSGGTGPYTYRWTPETNLSSRTTQSPIFLSNLIGTFPYTFEVIDANGCVASSNVIVSVNNRPIANAGNSRQTCVGSPVQLMGSATSGAGNYSYRWSPAENLSDANIMNPVFQSSIPGVYNLSLTVTDGNGCSDVSTVSIAVNFDLTVSAGQNKGVCRGGNPVVLEGSISGGSQEGATFAWNPVTFLSNPGSLRPTFSSQVPGTYTYTLTVTDVNGCRGTDEVQVTVVNPPLADAGADQLVCTQASIRLNGSATNGSGDYSYSWSPASRLNDAMIASPIFASSAPNVYNLTLRVTDNVSGCSSTDLVQVNVVSIPTPELVITQTDVSCDGDRDGTITATARIDARFPFQRFEYSIDGINYQTSNFFSNLAPGQYTVFAKNETQCIVSGLAVINNPATVQITGITDVTDNSAMVTWTSYNGRGNVNYTLQYRIVGQEEWSSIDVTARTNMFMLTGLQNFTAYEARIRARCNGVLSPNWSEVASFRTLQTAQGTCKVPGGVFANQVNGANAMIINWNSDATGVCYDVQYGLSTVNPSTWTIVSGVTTNSLRINNLTPGFTYSARVRTNCLSCQGVNGNRSNFSQLITFTVDNARGMIVKEVVTMPEMSVYPNPTTGIVNVEFTAVNGEDATISVMDMTGRVVYNNALTTVEGANNVAVDLTGKAAGIYNIVVTRGGQKQTVKVTLQ